MATDSGVYTQQQTAVTRADRMPEWLREGTARLDAQTHGMDSRSDNGSSDRQQSSSVSSDLGTTQDAPDSNSPSNTPSLFGQSTQDQPLPPSSSLTAPGKRRATGAAIDPVRPQWGLRSPNGTIGYEREVRVHVSSTQVTVGEDSAFQLGRDIPLSDLRRLLAASVDREVRAWGDPPRSFYWVPSIRFIVGPGAGPAQQRLKGIVETWGLRSSVQYTAD